MRQPAAPWFIVSSQHCGLDRDMQVARAMRAAVFLDRDGVLIEDVHLLTDPPSICMFECTPPAIQALKDKGFRVIVVSNQTVVARGLATEEDVRRVHDRIQELLREANGSQIDAFYFCPHHPNATLPDYRIDCNCRKPRPGMLMQAAHEHDIDLGHSYMVGDRITDIIAGMQAGCETILVQTGAHLQEPIETTEPLDLSIRPDFVCQDLAQATDYILESAA